MTFKMECCKTFEISFIILSHDIKDIATMSWYPSDIVSLRIVIWDDDIYGYKA